MRRLKRLKILGALVLEGGILGGFIWWIMGVVGMNLGEPKAAEAEKFIRGYYVGAREGMREVLGLGKEADPFVLEDFNADGYLDLTVKFYYGANGGTASHYIFSPSQRKFVKLANELDCYGEYFLDPDTRILYVNYRDSAISGTETAYQWEGEMDYKKIRQFEHDDVGEGVRVKIVRYNEEKKEVICDYKYSMEEYDRRMEEIWGIYYKDFIWEKEVTDKSTGGKYMLRYAEEFKKELAARNNGVYYDGRLYVFDEDTYLVQVWKSEIVERSTEIAWKEDEQELVIHYGEGSSVLSAEWLFDNAD